MAILQDWFYRLRNFFRTHAQLRLEVEAMRSQLALFNNQVIDGKRPKPVITDSFRKRWVFFSQKLDLWKSALILVKPETVLHWHKRAFKCYWRRKSRGRPHTSIQTIALIKRIHRENPLLSPEKIYERMLDMNIADAPSPNIIAKYIHKPKRKPPSDRQQQS